MNQEHSSRSPHAASVSTFPDERRIAVEMAEDIRRIRAFMELADDLRPFLDPSVMDDIETIVAIVEVERGRS